MTVWDDVPVKFQHRLAAFGIAQGTISRIQSTLGELLEFKRREAGRIDNAFQTIGQVVERLNAIEKWPRDPGVYLPGLQIVLDSFRDTADRRHTALSRRLELLELAARRESAGEYLKHWGPAPAIPTVRIRCDTCTWAGAGKGGPEGHVYNYPAHTVTVWAS